MKDDINKGINIMHSLRNRSTTGSFQPSKVLLHIYAKARLAAAKLAEEKTLANPTQENITCLIKATSSIEPYEQKEKENIKLNILNSPFRDKLQSFHLSDLSKQFVSVKNKILRDPLLFNKLTPNSLTKVAYYDSDPLLALQIVSGIIHTSQVENPSAQQKNVMKLAKKHAIVALRLFELPEILKNLGTPHFSALKEAHPMNKALHKKIDDELTVRAANPPPRKRIRLSSMYD